MTEKKREEVYGAAEALASAAGIVPTVIFKTAKEIDKRGIAVVIREALAEGLVQVLVRAGAKSDECLVLLDGGLKAPAEFLHQETIIKGDAKEPAIGLASIYAKVTRDHYMTAIANKKAFLQYGFAVHKGYGTKKHREAITKYGTSKEHRVSFCKNCLE
jgi:ribonuclease HII